MISVIIISHNYGNYIKKCVSSILSNDQNLIKEIIIVNDSSSDNTDNIIKKNFFKISKIKYYKKNFLSLSKSYNFAVSEAKEKWIIKVDADDYVKNDFILEFYKFAEKNRLDYVYGDLLIQNDTKKISFIKKQKINNYVKFFKYPVGSGILYKKKIWKHLKGFNEKIYYQDDYDFWLKIINNKKFKIGYLDEAKYIYRKHKTNMSRNILKKNLTKFKVFFSNIFSYF